METKPDFKLKKTFIRIAAISGILGCLIDTGATFFYGARIEGFNQFKIPMSQMGILSSPVAREISISWILMGIFLIIFGLGLRFAYEGNKRSAIVICWLLILFGCLIASPTNFLAVYKGTWQRLYVFVYYIYIIIISVNMIVWKVPFEYPEKALINA